MFAKIKCCLKMISLKRGNSLNNVVLICYNTALTIWLRQWQWLPQLLWMIHHGQIQIHWTVLGQYLNLCIIGFFPSSILIVLSSRVEYHFYTNLNIFGVKKIRFKTLFSLWFKLFRLWRFQLCEPYEFILMTNEVYWF